MTIQWTELGRKDLECRVPCPKCNGMNYVRGYDTPYYWEIEAKHRSVTMQCEKCKAFFEIRKRKEGVTVL